MINSCDCKHAYQDKRHGSGRRVHTQKDNGKIICTVCEKEKDK